MEPRMYRGIDVQSNQWVYGYLVYYPTSMIVSGENVYNVVPESVGESILSADIRGTQIFTGDYIKHGNLVYVVQYVPQYSRYSAVRPRVVCSSILLGKNVEVIGNEFQNPELNPYNTLSTEVLKANKRVKRMLNHYINRH